MISGKEQPLSMSDCNFNVTPFILIVSRHLGNLDVIFEVTQNSQSDSSSNFMSSRTCLSVSSESSSDTASML